MSLLLQTLKHSEKTSPRHEAVGEMPLPTPNPAPLGLFLAPEAASPAPRTEPIFVDHPAPVLSPEPSASSATSEKLFPTPPASAHKSLLPWWCLGGLLFGGLGIWLGWQCLLISPVAAANLLPTQKTMASAPAQHTEAPTVIRPQPAIALPTTNKPIPPISIEPKLKRQVREVTTPAPLMAAWNAFQQGDLVTAENQYHHMLAADPRNRDALLGLATITARQERRPEAQKYYHLLLTLDPQDEEAQAGLLILDPAQMNEHHEAQLLQQADRHHASLALAHYYAAHQRWHEAQEQYFHAFTQDPGNADLAFNLAISLDQIRQPGPAAEYYRKALALTRGSFDRASAEKRLAVIMAEKP